MPATLIATRDTDRLYSVGSYVDEIGDKTFHGYIQAEDGSQIRVPNIEVLLAHGYWNEIVD